MSLITKESFRAYVERERGREITPHRIVLTPETQSVIDAFNHNWQYPLQPLPPAYFAEPMAVDRETGADLFLKEIDNG